MSTQGYTFAPMVARHHSQSVNHGTSSAFSSSANPDEDWTQISDLAERRRIQNRIAQRNYRKKLKRRLEDLERRAGSSSASPPSMPATLKQPRKSSTQDNSYKSNVSNTNSRQTHTQNQKLSPRIIPHHQYTPPMHPDDDIFTNPFDRDGSHTPPLFAYHHSYPAPEDNLYAPYPSISSSSSSSFRPAVSMPGLSHHSLPTTTSTDPYDDYLAPSLGPMTLPSMLHFTDSLKHPHSNVTAAEDMSLNPFSMSYASMAGIEPTNVAYDDHGHGSNPHTPPLSLSHQSFGEPGSDMGFSNSNYPGTPLSMPGSPVTYCL